MATAKTTATATATAPATAMCSLLQMSDPHFGTERPGAVEALVRLVARQRPALVVLSGDITQRATPEQFAAARAFVDRLAPVPVLAVPGNHDIPLYDVATRLLRPYARYAAAFGDAVDRVHAGDDWHVVALNTTRQWRHKNGEVSARQVAFAAASLRAAAAGAVKVVVTHQPVAVADGHDAHDLLRGGAEAARAWHAAGADLVLGGHIHLPFIVPLHDRGAASGVERRPMWGLQAGTAVSSRVRNGTLNSVTEVLALPTQAIPSASGPGGAARACTVRFWGWADGAQDFVAQDDVLLALGNAANARVPSPRSAGRTA